MSGTFDDRPDPKARQLAFDLSRDPCFDEDDFLVAPSNRDAFVAVRSWPAWPDRAFLLVGPPGSGKSHLAAIWAAAAGAQLIGANNLVPSSEAGAALLMEDCDRRPHDEHAFFHLLNSVRATGGWLLMTARCSPDQWGLQTPDLLSRLRLAPTAHIERPDAALMKAVLVKLFADRQLTVDEDVVAYAARHCEQSLDALRRFATLADEASLVDNRRITRPLAAKIIARMNEEGPRS